MTVRQVVMQAANKPIFFIDLHHARQLGVIYQPGSVPQDAVVLKIWASEIGRAQAV